MTKYTVVESKQFRRDDGRVASIHGAHPEPNAKDRWTVVTVGYTVRNADGTIGIGRPPWKTREEAEAWAYRYNNPHYHQSDGGCPCTCLAPASAYALE